jgi:hypothetical protein
MVASCKLLTGSYFNEQSSASQDNVTQDSHDTSEDEVCSDVDEHATFEVGQDSAASSGRHESTNRLSNSGGCSSRNTPTGDIKKTTSRRMKRLNKLTGCDNDSSDEEDGKTVDRVKCVKGKKMMKLNTVRGSDSSDDDNESSDKDTDKMGGRDKTSGGKKMKKLNTVRGSDSSDDDNESSDKDTDKMGGRDKTSGGKKMKKLNTVRGDESSDDDSESSDKDNGKTEGRIKTAKANRKRKSHTVHDSYSSDDEGGGTGYRPRTSRGKRKQKSQTICGSDLSDNDDSMTEDRIKPTEYAVTEASRKRMSKRVRWSQQELNILKRYLKSDKPPDEESIRSVMDRFPVLKQRSVPQIKSRAWHLIKTGR